MDRTDKPKPKTNLPALGAVLSREYRGAPVEVEVLEEGFRYKDRVFRSLSAVAKDIHRELLVRTGLEATFT